MGMPSRNYIFVLAWLMIAFAASACLSPPDYPDTPEVEFISLSRDTLDQDFNRKDSLGVRIKSLFLTVGFTDGDGDIIVDDTTFSVFILNRVTRDTLAPFQIDAIETAGLENGINGEFRLLVPTTCCTYPETLNAFPCNPSADFPIDRLLLEIYMVDRAGNESNHAEVPPITLRCN